MKDYRFLRFPNFKDKALTLSYDDGVVFDKKLISIMDIYGIKGTFNINSELFADVEGGRRMTKQEILNLFMDSHHEVALHGAKHLSLSTVPEEIATKDILIDRINLENMFKKPICGLAYANGSYDDKVVEILKNCGVKYARTTISTGNFNIPTDWLRMPTTCHHTNPKLMEYTTHFLEDESKKYYWSQRPKLFYLWGHSYEFNDNDNWEIIERFAQMVGNRDDVWYATNIEVYEYIEAFDNLVWGVNGNFIYNPSAQDVYIEYLGKEILIPTGKTVEV